MNQLRGMGHVAFASMALMSIVAASCGDDRPGRTDPPTDPPIDPPINEQGWPEIRSEIAQDPIVEQAIAALLATMSLEQKVGQMVQAEIQAVTPAQARQYHLGSVLNGGGSWPGQRKNASAADWVALADSFYEASMDTSGKPGQFLPIPLIWGTDAVHGHNNVLGATLFPHNIGLGAANDPDLIERVARVTAREVATTGLDWTFAPTLAVVRDDRWGRTYEGFAEDPEIVRSYARRMIVGLQGAADSPDLFGEEQMISTAKHFLGDGGTLLGKDQGDNVVSEAELIKLHAQGYFSALAAGAQTVMASFSSWQGQKMHGQRYLLTDILKGKLGFDGFVIGDWNGHAQLPGCSNGGCAAAINAGVDMIMVPNEWREFIASTIADVDRGAITTARIDDAVTRILRVKMRAGLLGPHVRKGAPSTRPLAGRSEILGKASHRAVAREAVQKSLVLLKNDGGILPLRKDMQILVAGRGADNLQLQTGGWSLSWQGNGNSNADFPNGESIYAGVRAKVEEAGGAATLSASGTAASPEFDAIIVVLGESPYAEGQGDISKFSTLEHRVRYPEDLRILETVRERAPGVPIVTVFLSGRPLYVNREINRSDAFVAAWLPGSEGAGVADVLFADAAFSGKLSYSWPASDCQTVLNRGDGKTALFPYGFGLTFADSTSMGNSLPEMSSSRGCDAPDIGDAGTTNEPLEIFTNGSNRGDYRLRIGGPSNWGGIDVATEPTQLPGAEVTTTTVDGSLQASAKRAKWNSTGQLYSQLTEPTPGRNLAPYANSETSIRFRVRVDQPPALPLVKLAVHCVYPCVAEIDIGNALLAVADGQWHELSFPLQCLLNRGLDITNVNTPFLLYTEQATTMSVENVRWEPFTAGANPDCTSLAQPKQIIDQPVLPLYTDSIGSGFVFTAFNNTAGEQVDLGNGNFAWVGNLITGSNIAIRKSGLIADMSAYNIGSGRLIFDLRVMSYENEASDLLVKIATSWPYLSDVRVFAEILGTRPPIGVWTTVTIPIADLVSSQNDLAPGNYVDISAVVEPFVIEAIGGAATVQLDNVRWER